jgi:RNA polymerase sigma factor (sigma-70 family)
VTELPDEIIMDRVKQGNLSELSVLFERYQVRMFNFFLKQTFDKIISQDLTQNLFYRVLKYRHTYKAENSFKSWIYQMARNVHVDYYTEQKRTAERFQNVERYENNITDRNENYGEDDFERLDKALVKLHPEQLEIIVLSRFQGLSYDEISRINNASVGSIKVQMHRAIKHLRDLYFKQE